jgi:autotransporter-associated beta strand protein
VNGANTLTITNSGGANTGDVTFTGAVGGTTALTGLTITTDVLTAAAIKSTGTLSVTNSGTSSITGIISEGVSALAVTKAGTGILTLSGVNTYTGLTTISEGALTASNAAALGNVSSGTTVASGAALQITTSINAEPLTLNGTGISSGGALRNISGDNTYAGAITLATASRINSDSGTLTLNKSTDAITGTNVNLTIGGSGNTTVSTIISTGSGTLTKDGSGTLTLSGANSYTGLTTISAGVVTAANNTALGTVAGGVTVADGAALQLSGVITIGAEALTLNGTGISSGGALRNISGDNTYGGLITLATASRINSDSGLLTLDVASGNGITGTFNITFGGANNISVADPIDTSTGTLTKDGSGTLFLSGANNYTGATTISAGIIRASHASAFGTTAGGITVASGAVLELSGGITIGAEALTLNNRGIFSNGALRNISGDNSYTGVITLSTNIVRINSDSGTLTLTGGIINNAIGLTFGGVGNITVSTAAIGSGAGTLTKDGSGTLTLSVANTYTGLTTVSAGSLTYGINNAISTGAVTVNGSTAILALGSYTDSVGAVTLTAGSITGSGTLTGASYTLNPTSGTSHAIEAVLAGQVRLTSQGSSGTVVTLTGTNTYTGGTYITSGTLSIGGATGNVLLDTGAVVFSNTAGAILNINGKTETIGKISGGGASGGNITLGTGGALTVNQIGFTNYSGVISGDGSFTKSGYGTLMLSRASTYTGTTYMSDGDLIINTNNALPNTPLTFTGASNIYMFNSNLTQSIGTLTGIVGAKIDLSGASSVLTINQATGSETTYSGTIIGIGSVVKNGSGTLILEGSNTYTGGTTINAGILRIAGSSGNVLSNNGFVILANTTGAQLDLNGKTETIGSLSGGGTSGGYIALGTSGALTVNQFTNTTYDGVISGNGSFTKTSYGVLTLGGVNTYGGVTTLSGGDVIILASNAIPNTALTFTGAARLLLIRNDISLEVGSLTSDGVTGSVIWLYNNSVLTINQTSNTTFDGVITSNLSGSIVKNNSGILTLSGVNSYSGNTTINAGTLRITGSGSLGEGNYSGYITNNGILQYSSSASQTLTRSISGSGSLVDDERKITNLGV